MEKESNKTIEIPQDIQASHYRDYAQAIMDQLANPNVKDVDLAKAAKKAKLPTTADPTDVVESDAFNFMLDSVGLTDEFLAKALYEDIELKPQNRVQELKLAAQLKGVASPSKADPNMENAKTVSKAMDMIDKLIDNKKAYVQGDDGDWVEV